MHAANCSKLHFRFHCGWRQQKTYYFRVIFKPSLDTFPRSVHHLIRKRGYFDRTNTSSMESFTVVGIGVRQPRLTSVVQVLSCHFCLSLCRAMAQHTVPRGVPRCRSFVPMLEMRVNSHRDIDSKMQIVVYCITSFFHAGASNKGRCDAIRKRTCPHLCPSLPTPNQTYLPEGKDEFDPIPNNESINFQSSPTVAQRNQEIESCSRCLVFYAPSIVFTSMLRIPFSSSSSVVPMSRVSIGKHK